MILTTYSQMFQENNLHRDFPGGPVVKNSRINAGDTDSTPGLRRSHVLQDN